VALIWEFLISLNASVAQSAMLLIALLVTPYIQTSFKTTLDPLTTSETRLTLRATSELTSFPSLITKEEMKLLRLLKKSASLLLTT